MFIKSRYINDLVAAFTRPRIPLRALNFDALQAWSEGMYFELSHFGIGVKTLVPGFIKTNLVNSADIAQIRGVSPKMLSQSLRQLEERGLIRRQVYPEVPPRVEYSLTEMGQSLAPLLVELCDWSVEWEAREPALPASPGPVVLVAGSAVSQPSKMRAEKG